MSVHKDNNTNTWYFTKRIKKLDGSIIQARRRGFKTKKEALIAEVKFNPDSSDKMNLDLLYDLYIKNEANHLKESTLYLKQKRYEKYIKPYFGKMYVNDIDVASISKWRELIKDENIETNTKNQINGLFSQIIEFGKEFYNVKVNIVKKLGMFVDHEVKKIQMITKADIWSEDEFKQFISEATSTTYYVFFNLLYYTGMRKGEARALSFEDVDLENKKIKIYKNIIPDHNGKKSYRIVSPKSEKSVRIIDIPKNLVEILNNYIENLKTQKIRYKNSDFLCGIDKPLANTTIGNVMDDMIEHSGVKRITPHGLRHTHASILIYKNVDINYLKERLGHEDISITLNTYVHILQEAKEKMTKIIDEL